MTELLYKVSQGTSKVQVWSAWNEGANVHTKYGQQNGKMQEKVYTAIATNVGRSNERDPEQQAKEEVEKLYEAQQANKHYRYNLEDAWAMYNDCKEPRKVKNYKDTKDKMSDKLLTSVKLNGSRACVIEGSLYSKIGKKENIKVKHIREAVAALKEYSFDNEVFAPNMSLQRIRSAWLKPVKTEKEIIKFAKDRSKVLGEDNEFLEWNLLSAVNYLGYNPNEDAPKLSLYVFDIPVKDVIFHERVNMMIELEKTVKLRGLEDVIKFQYPFGTCSQEHRLQVRDKAVKDGFEGLVHYEYNDLYLFGTRSSTTCKDKPRFDTEVFVESVTKDKSGEGVLHVRASDKMDRVKLKCKMKVHRRDGGEHPRDFNTMQGLTGKWITMSYEELSDTGTMTKPVGEEERECDVTGEPIS